MIGLGNFGRGRGVYHLVGQTQQRIAYASYAEVHNPGGGGGAGVAEPGGRGLGLPAAMR